MTRVKIGKLKANLSRYLHLVQRGEKVLVLDRKQPIAEIVPLPGAEPLWERLAREGKCKLGTQDWKSFRPLRLKRSIPIEQILRDVGEDAL